MPKKLRKRLSAKVDKKVVAKAPKKKICQGRIVLLVRKGRRMLQRW